MSTHSSDALARETLLWTTRAFVYDHFARTARPPSVDETAATFHISPADAADLHRELHERHALFLDADTGSIRMANPFSAVPTDFRVHARGLTYWANCAWDALGIPAALHADATIDAHCASSGVALPLSVHDGHLAPSDAVIHFLVPFRAWYDDLVYT